MSRAVEDWKTIANSDVNEPKPNESNCNEALVATIRHDEKKVKEAKQKELENWRKFNVYEEVTNTGQSYISVRWVCTEKETESGENIIKARLVARGFEECNKIRADSPTVSKEVLRIFLAIMASNKWKCNSIDVKAAFLQGENLSEIIKFLN